MIPRIEQPRGAISHFLGVNILTHIPWFPRIIRCGFSDIYVLLSGNLVSSDDVPYSHNLTRLPLLLSAPLESQPQRLSAGDMHPHHRGAVPITRRGIQITMSKRGNAEDSGIGGAAPGLRRSRNGGPSNNNSTSTRSSLSLYGDNVYHSFKVCGAPDCELCTKDGRGRWRAAFLVHDEGWAKRNGSPFPGASPSLGVIGAVSEGMVAPKRSLIQRACEHCRMPYIPKSLADASLEHGGLSSTTGSVDELDVSESSSDRQGSGYRGSPRDGGVVVLEGSLAGGSTGSVSSASSVVGAGEEGKTDGPLSPLGVMMSNRPPSVSSSPESHQSSVSSSRSGSVSSMFTEESDYDGFCSGDCKMSYMLSTPMAIRRRRAAAEARAAAAYAAHLNPQM